MTARSVTLHAHGYRDGRPVDASQSFAIQADRLNPVEAATRARALGLSGHWRSVPKEGGDLAKFEYALRRRVPEALVLLPRAVLAALTRNPDQAGCRWDLARFFAALDGQAEPDRTEATRAALGEPCGRCRMDHAAAARMAEVRAEVEAEQQLLASGHTPLAARVVVLGRRHGLPSDAIKQAAAAARRPARRPARPPALPPPLPAQQPTTPTYYRHRGWPSGADRRQPLEGWSAARLRQAAARRPAP